MKTSFSIPFVVCCLGFAVGASAPKLDFQHARAEPEPLAAPIGSADSESDRATAPATEGSAAVLPDSVLAGLPADSALSEYLEMVHEGRSSLETIAYLEEWFRANPEGTDDLVDLLHERVEQGQSSGTRGMSIALRRVQTPQARGVLLDPGFGAAG